MSISLPSDVRAWIEREAGTRRMTKSDYVLRLITLGIQVESVDELAARIRSAVSGQQQTESLRQILAIRYIVEAQARGDVAFPNLLGTEANAYADRELRRLFDPKANGNRQVHDDGAGPADDEAGDPFLR